MPLPAGYVTGAGISVKGIQRTLSRLYHQKLSSPAPIAAATNNILTTKAGPNTTTVVYSTTDSPLFDGTLFSGGRVVLDYARNIVITVTHATAVVALSGVITGKDIFGDVMTEAWSVTAGGTSKTFTGKKAFQSILSVSVVAAADASADSVVIGTGTVFGLDVTSQIGGAGASVKEIVDGSLVTTGTLVAKSATDDPRGTYSPATAPNGAHTYECIYITDDPEFS